MYMVEIYWHLKFLLGRVLVDINERIENILLSLYHMQHQLIALDHRLSHIERHMGIPLELGCSLGSNKKPIL